MVGGSRVAQSSPSMGPLLSIMALEHVPLWMPFCCPWQPWQYVGSHQAPCLFHEEIDTLKGQVSRSRSTQLSEAEPNLNPESPYKLRVIPLVPKSSSLNSHGRGLLYGGFTKSVPWGALFPFTLPQICQWEKG